MWKERSQQKSISSLSTVQQKSRQRFIDTICKLVWEERSQQKSIRAHSRGASAHSRRASELTAEQHQSSQQKSISSQQKSMSSLSPVQQKNRSTGLRASRCRCGKDIQVAVLAAQQQLACLHNKDAHSLFMQDMQLHRHAVLFLIKK